MKQLKEIAIFLGVIAVATSPLLIAGCAKQPPVMVSGVKVTKDPERICATAGDQCRYMIFTDKEVFINVDAPAYGKHNSSDVYAQIKKGDVCTFQVVGTRNQERSEYRNVLTADCRV